MVPTGTQKAWSDEVFFEVVEALDEVAARPRQRRWHSFHAGWDYANHPRLSGQAVYRWRVNEMLDASVVPFRLTDTECDEVAHAVVPFRARGATREAKRSDEAYPDWIFWWYLATIELSDHLLARAAPGTS